MLLPSSFYLLSRISISLMLGEYLQIQEKKLWKLLMVKKSSKSPFWLFDCAVSQHKISFASSTQMMHRYQETKPMISQFSSLHQFLEWGLENRYLWTPTSSLIDLWNCRVISTTTMWWWNNNGFWHNLMRVGQKVLRPTPQTAVTSSALVGVENY